MLPRLSTEERLMTKQEFLYELQKETLNKLRPYLCNHLEPERLFPYLQSKNCLSLDDCEQIRSMNTTKNKVNKLVDILIKCGPDTLMSLIKAIKKSSKTQVFIAEKLNKDYEERTNKEDNKKKLDEINRNAGRNNININPTQQPPPYPPPYSPTPDDSLYVSDGRTTSIPSGTQPACVSGTMRPGTSPVNPERPPLLRPTSRIPVTGEWPSNTSSCFTSHFMERVENFHSSDYPRDVEENPPPYVDDQNEKLSIYNQENSTLQGSYPDFDATWRTSPEPLRPPLRHQPRLPDEHDSSSTEVKRVRENDVSLPESSSELNAHKARRNEETSSERNHTMDSSVSANSSSISIRHPPDDVSFEVSGDVSTSLF